jgi:hypothetical protein
VNGPKLRRARPRRASLLRTPTESFAGYDRCVDGLNEYATVVVRLFPDYGVSPLWFAIGNLTYEQAALTEELTRDLRRWEASFYDNFDSQSHWSSAEAAREFVSIGQALAARLADELGHTFEVEVDSGVTGESAQRFRGGRVPTNLKAARAFRAMSDKQVAAFARVRTLQQAGHSFHWSAMAPRSGSRFAPSSEDAGDDAK